MFYATRVVSTNPGRRTSVNTFYFPRHRWRKTPQCFTTRYLESPHLSETGTHFQTTTNAFVSGCSGCRMFFKVF
jgi:hypothetical protein